MFGGLSAGEVDGGDDLPFQSTVEIGRGEDCITGAGIFTFSGDKMTIVIPRNVGREYNSFMILKAPLSDGSGQRITLVGKTCSVEMVIKSKKLND